MPQLLGFLGSTLLAMGAGASFVAQQAVNAELRTELNSAAWAGFVSYLGGTVCMLGLALALRQAVPLTDAVARSQWWAWTGGFFGAIYIAVSILLVPRLGTATFVALLIAGQMLTSLAFDHYGVFNLARHEADPTRIIGAVLLIAGVVCMRL